MSCAEVFLFKADVSSSENCSVSVKKKAVSDFSHKFVSEHVSRMVGVPAEKLKYVFGEHGKPYIKGNPIYFNVSHCGNVILTAFCQEEIGVDIEIVREFNSDVPKRFFTEEERQYIDLSADKAEENRRFFEIWTAKEAFLKFCGVGISGGFDFCTADEKGVRGQIFSSKLGNANIIHCGGKIKLDKKDVLIYNDTNCNCCLVDYQISVCGREIDRINFQLVQNM